MLTDAQLKNAGVESKEDRKIVLNVIKKAGFKSPNRSGIATSVGIVKSSHDIASSEASTSGSASRASAATVCFSSPLQPQPQLVHMRGVFTFLNPEELYIEEA